MSTEVKQNLEVGTEEVKETKKVNKEKVIKYGKKALAGLALVAAGFVAGAMTVGKTLQPDENDDFDGTFEDEELVEVTADEVVETEVEEIIETEEV